MKVELLVSRAGPEGAHDRGSVIEVSSAEAQRMIEAGQARPVRRSKPEKAVPDGAPEKASR